MRISSSINVVSSQPLSVLPRILADRGNKNPKSSEKGNFSNSILNVSNDTIARFGTLVDGRNFPAATIRPQPTSTLLAKKERKGREMRHLSANHLAGKSSKLVTCKSCNTAARKEGRLLRTRYTYSFTTLEFATSIFCCTSRFDVDTGTPPAEIVPLASNRFVSIFAAPSSATCGFQNDNEEVKEPDVSLLSLSSISTISLGDVYCKYQTPSNNCLAIWVSVNKLGLGGKSVSNLRTNSSTRNCCFGVAVLPFSVYDTAFNRSCFYVYAWYYANGMRWVRNEDERPRKNV